MKQTSIDLYRMGNATSPRMDNVRPQDVEYYESSGEIWVVENSGGISTFAIQGAVKNWWKLDQGAVIPDALHLVNDYGDHWAWEPGYTMRLDEYKTALQSVAPRFYKMSYRLTLMDLSPKVIRFIVDALDYRIKAYKERLCEELDEDEVSDISNDCLFLEAIREDLAQTIQSKVPVA